MRLPITMAFMVASAGVLALSAQEQCGCDGPPLPEVVATVNGVRITPADIDEPIRADLDTLRRQVIEARKRELGLQINSRLLDTEAKRRGISPTKLLQDEVISKVRQPTDADAQIFFEQNRGRLSGEFKDLKDSIISHLKQQRENEEAKRLADRLRQGADLKVLVREATPPANDAERSRVFANVLGQTVTSADVENALGRLLSETRWKIYELRENQLQARIAEIVLQQEALARKMTVRALLEKELTPAVRMVTETDIRDFYDKNKDRISGPYDQLRSQISEHLQKQERNKAEMAFVNTLRKRSSIVVSLVAPASQNSGSDQ